MSSEERRSPTAPAGKGKAIVLAALEQGASREANLIDVEYIVSESLYGTLPAQERASWHPHNLEILSGQLVAPGLADVAEKAFMKRLLNSYGKTWHTWHTGRHDGEQGHALPIGDPTLMWSFNPDGECDSFWSRTGKPPWGWTPPRPGRNASLSSRRRIRRKA